ncbi:hypothetical protein [Streptomyces sp. NPDC059072]|uniref:hypothetical protein n=1 Tax=unclassified Streptomyces TaxID=2593676 RepID=UPI0036A13609
MVILGAVATGSALPAVRARLVAARRNDHTTFGTVDGTVRMRSDHKLRFALEDGSELLIGNPTVEPADSPSSPRAWESGRAGCAVPGTDG